ncbi:nuclear transport factor 2 family protein [Muriicola sp. SD30]|uniref:nuclear transport factor 2 family protein n=1 Tax=Muriicola sp. SD30 TaxID=3240936 RepID=UPI00351017E7
MNKILFLLISISMLSHLQAQTSDTELINTTLDNWHKAAAEADFNAYFDLMTKDAVFIGTDAAEVWNKPEFMAFSKPYFEQGKAWNFTSIDRNLYIDPSGSLAWFDELLNTWMQLCRGSGVLKKENGEWKIAHYVLSLTIPNDEIQPVIELKKEKDSIFSSSLLKQ